jgi:P4 family phage/plasmid primase-like protien
MTADPVMDKWKCLRCGDEFEALESELPQICNNPGCGKRGPFFAESGIFKGHTITIRGITDKIATDIIMGKHLFYCDKNDKNTPLYVWNNGVWHNGLAEGVVLHDLSEMFKNVQSRDKMKLEKSVNFIKGRAMDTVVKEKPPHFIVFKNGVLNIETMTLREHDPSFFCINKIPHDYDSAAECPKFLKFLEEVVRKEDIPFLQEWVGYNFLTSYPEVGFLILTGVGQNGKSIFIAIFVHVLGSENVTTISLADLTYDTFAPAELWHKLANISDDIGTTTIVNAGKLRLITGGGRITVQRKFGQEFDIEPYAKVTYTCNEPPEIKDESDAIKFRLKVVEFPHVFSKNPKEGEFAAKDRKELEAELKAETLGIINWAIEGLRRFLANNATFSVSKSTEETWQFYQRKSKPVFTFADECLEITDDDSDKLTIDVMYSLLKNWIKRTKIQLKISRDKMIKQLKEYGIETRQKREDDRKRVYYGVKCHDVTLSNNLPLDANLESDKCRVIGAGVTPCQPTTGQQKIDLTSASDAVSKCSYLYEVVMAIPYVCAIPDPTDESKTISIGPCETGQIIALPGQVACQWEKEGLVKKLAGAEK